MIIGFVFMEFVAWSNHKYIMHGFLWKWHKDHHTRDRDRILLKDLEKTEQNKLEKNDYFFVIYAFPAIVLMIIGFALQIYPLVFLSIGITLYGMTYFLFHDIAIHQRIKFPYLQNSRNKYLRAIIKAHVAHHRPKNKKDFDNFGLLIFSSKYFKD